MLTDNNNATWKSTPNTIQAIDEVQFISPREKERQGKFDLLVLETCLTEHDRNAWILDSGSTNNVCFSLQGNGSFQPLEVGEMTLSVGTGDVVSASAVGDAKLFFKDRFLLLENLYIVPQL